MLEFTSTSEVHDLYVKGAVYAGSGVGKTMLIRTMPGRKIIIGRERGELSLAPANQIRVFGNYEEIPIIRISTEADLKASFELVSGPKGEIFQSVGIDSASDIAESILNEKLGIHKDPRRAYGEMQEIMGKYIRRFRDMPRKHVMFTAKQDMAPTADGLNLFQPSMPGKTMTQDFPYFFDFVFALQISPKDAAGKEHRYLRCKPNNQFSAKDRSGILDEMEKPDIGAIIAKIKNQ